MLCILKFFFFLLIITTFGYFSLKQILKIKSQVVLIPLSISFGIASYIFLCHVTSFICGPQLASYISTFILLALALVIFFISYKTHHKVKLETKKTELIIIISIATLICTLTFLAIYRIGPFDKYFHIPLTLTIFHNNIYPPKEFFNGNQLLLYHYGGDLLAGGIYHLTNLDIFRSYELILTVLAGTTFLSFFALGWLLTNSFKISIIGALCTYLGGGLLYLDAIIGYLFKYSPRFESGNFIHTFITNGIHGSIINPPSIQAFLSTSGVGIPILILSLILTWNMLQASDSKNNFAHIIFLTTSLFSLFLSAEWLYLTFLAGALPYAIILFLKKQKKSFILIIILLASSLILNKIMGGTLFFQNEVSNLGRANIYNISLKENFFQISRFGKLSAQLLDYETISIFSFDFIAEFGLSLFLFPIALIYLVKVKNMLAILLFLCSIFTIPLPLVIDFKTDPANFNRFFAFGNTMIILLICCGISTLFKSFFKNKVLTIAYLLAFCLSPAAGLVTSAVFTPYIFIGKNFAGDVFNNLNNAKSPKDIFSYWRDFNASLIKDKNEPFYSYKQEIEFLKNKSKPKDVAISSLYEIPYYAGVYTIIPSKILSFKDQLYSKFDSTYLTAITTLDPYLLDELNIKWILITNEFKESLLKDTNSLLNNKDLLELAFVNTKNALEIYHVKGLKEILKNYKRKTAWLLVDKFGKPIEISFLREKRITLFPTSKSALLYLKHLYNLKAELKKELITSQAVTITNIESLIKGSNLNITLEKNLIE